MRLAGSRLTALQVAAGLVALALSAGVLLYATLVSPDVPFIVSDGDAEWITSPRIASTWESTLRDDEPSPGADFERAFELERVPRDATLEVKALRDVTLLVNGRAQLSPQRSCLKRACQIEVARWLHPGRNTLRVTVTNRRGPPLLHLRLHGTGLALASDGSWRATGEDGRWFEAKRADDRRRPVETWLGKTPLEALAALRGPVAGLFALSLLAFAAARRWLPQAARRRLPEIALAALTLAWVALFFGKIVRIPLDYGADAPHHVAYVRWILEHGSLPLADQGFQTYQPPLYYALTAGLVALFDPARGTLAEAGLYKLLPFLSALSLVYLTWALARRLLPDDPTARGMAVAVAGLLPASLSIASYPSNEALDAALSAAALVALVPILEDGRASPGRVAAVGLALGAALLAKYSAFAVLGIAAGFAAFRRVAVDRAGPARTLALPAAFTAIAVVMAAWVYARNWLHFGDPFVWNLDGIWGRTYWQQPGFHTLGYFTSFGGALAQPWYASFASFWDGLYSTTWGEGLPPGGHTFRGPHALWNYDFMALSFGVALPATAAGLLGLGLAARRALSHPREGLRVAWSLVVATLYALVFALVLALLAHPAWEGARAKYLLAAVPCGAVVCGLGLRAIDRRLARPGWGLLRAVFWGWLGTFAGVLWASFAA